LNAENERRQQELDAAALKVQQDLLAIKAYQDNLALQEKQRLQAE